MIAGLTLLALMWASGFALGHISRRRSREHEPRLVRLLPARTLTAPEPWPRAPRPLLAIDGMHCLDCGRTRQACAVTWGLNRDDPQRCEYITMRRALGYYDHPAGG